MLAELSIVPLGRGEHLSEALAEILDVLTAILLVLTQVASVLASVLHVTVERAPALLVALAGRLDGRGVTGL